MYIKYDANIQYMLQWFERLEDCNRWISSIYSFEYPSKLFYYLWTNKEKKKCLKNLKTNS